MACRPSRLRRPRGHARATSKRHRRRCLGLGRLIVRSISLADYRSYPRLELPLEPGLVFVTGPNGAGKTNLLEALHVATQGFSPRTRTDAQLVRFGCTAARATVRGSRRGVPVEAEVALTVRDGKRAQLNGARLRAAEQLRGELATLVFTPDRLAVVKGAPAVRRAYFDRVLGRFAPARAALPLEYGAAIAQRNASLRRVAGGYSPRAALDPWTEQVVTLGQQLVSSRRETIAALSPEFAERAEELGLPVARLVYEAEPPSVQDLEARLERDLERGTTGLGPHLDEIAVLAGDRDLRSFGSQGEQRLAVLSLLLAEAELLAQRSGAPPLLLLDDVLSELDATRRRTLAERVRAHGGQTVVTAAAADALPVEPDQLVEVVPGSARAA